MATTSSPDPLSERAQSYASRNGLEVRRQLGCGKDGTVFSTTRPSAIKAHRFTVSYQRERVCYERLREHDVGEIAGHTVPRLIAADDGLLVIEMTIVSSPFLLDFGDAYLDDAPEFPEDVIEQWHEEKTEQFGEARWDRVLTVMGILRGQHDIHLLDVNPGNITFGEDET